MGAVVQNYDVDSLDVSYWMSIVKESVNQGEKWHSNETPWQIFTLINIAQPEYLSDAQYEYCREWCLQKIDGELVEVCCDWDQVHEPSDIAFRDFLYNISKMNDVEPDRAYAFSEILRKKGRLEKSVEVLDMIPSFVDVSTHGHSSILEKSLKSKAKALYAMGKLEQADVAFDMALNISVLNALTKK